MMERTLPTFVTLRSALKKSSPEMAMGSLLRAPTMLYVVDEETRMLHAVV